MFVFITQLFYCNYKLVIHNKIVGVDIDVTSNLNVRKRVERTVTKKEIVK